MRVVRDWTLQYTGVRNDVGTGFVLFVQGGAAVEGNDAFAHFAQVGLGGDGPPAFQTAISRIRQHHLNFKISKEKKNVYYTFVIPSIFT
jgi:hypothetical protein